jgi:NAD(P)-dependent dehydrogenase (short-subunit alcohol dehydrogenase family)
MGGDHEHRGDVALAIDVPIDDGQHLDACRFGRDHFGSNPRMGRQIPPVLGSGAMSTSNPDEKPLSATSALVTGGASGMGEATARRLAAAGAAVVIVDRDTAKGEQVAGELGGTFAPADVTSEDDVTAAVAAATELAPLRTCIHCAGIGWAERTLNRAGVAHSLETFRKVLEVNLIGTFNVLRLAAAGMAPNEPNDQGERGVIVNTASIAAFDGQIGQAAYAASKGGVVALTLTAARDLAAVGIRVCTIAPGLIDTPLLGALPADARDALAQSVLFPKRLGIPADFASLAMEIVRNGYLNGEVLRMDAGIRMPPK